MYERFSYGSQNLLIPAVEEARSLHHAYTEPEHFLLAILGQEDTLTAQALNSLGVTHEKVRKHIVEKLGKNAMQSQIKIPYSRAVINMIENAIEVADARESSSVKPEHLLMGLLKVNGLAREILSDLDVTPEKVEDRIYTLSYVRINRAEGITPANGSAINAKRMPCGSELGFGLGYGSAGRSYCRHRG